MNPHKPGPDEFADRLLADWDTAMDVFYKAVDRKRYQADLTGAEVREALDDCYPDGVGTGWAEWYGEGDSYEE